MKGTYHIITYGCQMNESDSERLSGQLEELQYQPTDNMQEADVIVINTCCVRESAENKVYGKIGELKHLKDKNPNLVIGITGCMAQKNKEALFERAPHIDFVFGPYNIHHLKELLQSGKAVASHTLKTQMRGADITDFTDLHAVKAMFLPGCRSCRGATSFALIASCRMYAVANGVDRSSPLSKKYGNLPLQAIKKSRSWDKM